MNKLITFKVLGFTLVGILVLFMIDFSFWLMNQASTVTFVLGILLLVCIVGIPIELLIRRLTKK
jgi:uncharacterized membrane protein